MQSRRQEDYGTRASLAARLRDPRNQRGSRDHRLMHHLEVMERSPPPQRSLSPPGRVMGGGERRRRRSLEGTDYDVSEVRAGREIFRSQAPYFEKVNEKLPHYYDKGGYPSRDELRRKYDFCDIVDHRNELDTGLNRGGYTGFRGNVNGDRVFGVTQHQLLSERQMDLEHGKMHRGGHRLQAELEPSIRDAEDAGRYLLSSRNQDNGRFNYGRNQYPDPFLLEKLAAIEREERYAKVEELITQSRNVSYLKSSTSLSKDFTDISQLKEFAGAPSRSSRMNIIGSYQDDGSLPNEVHPSSLAQQEEHYLYTRLHKRHSLETRRDFEANHEDLLRCKRAALSPSLDEGRQRDYLYPRHGSIEKDNYGYTSEKLSGKLHYHERGYYFQGDSISPNVLEPTKQHLALADYSQRLHTSCDSWDLPSSRNQSGSEYLHRDRSLSAAEQLRMRMDSRNANVAVDDKVLVESEVPLLDIPPTDGLSHRSTRVSERDGLLVSGRESIRTPLDNQYKIQMQERYLRRKGISSEELYKHDLSRRSLKRKYHIDEELSSRSTKNTPSNKSNNLNGEDQHERGGEDQHERGGTWDSEKTIDLLPTKSLEYNHNKYTRTGRQFDHVEHGGDSTSDAWWSHDDQAEYLQEHSSKPFKPGKRTTRYHPRDGLPNFYKSSNSNQRHYHGTNVWTRAEDNKQLEEFANDTWESKFLVSSESGTTEDSEEFKQLVQEFFLSFSKMLNEKIGTRRRYKEEGRAGSLFCIVCGKSSSKEFMDTRSLATHCYMSPKVGLRARHLGLHKAICILLGWNSMVDRDVITFAPQAISSSEALAQKEDLILWPPTIIMHSISMSASHPGGQKVFTKEAVEDFLRGKGFSVGKIKVCPGMSENNDIMVAKFLGTFSGLQDAQNLHNYFVNEKHGRTDFEEMTLVKIKGNDPRKEKIQEDKSEEPVLYGYFGISEDLDKVDFDTKRKCSVKSKKEIEDIAEAPLRK